MRNINIAKFEYVKQQWGRLLWFNKKNNKINWYHSKSIYLGFSKRFSLMMNTNGAKKKNPLDTCYDFNLHFGFFRFSYTNWSY